MNNDLNKFLERVKTDNVLRMQLKNYFLCNNGKSFFDEKNPLGIESIIIEHPEESSNYHHGYRWSALYDRINEMHKQLSEPKPDLLVEIKGDLLEMYEAGGQYREALNEIVLAEHDENILDYKAQIEKLKDDNNDLINQMNELLRESAFKNENQVLEIQKMMNFNNVKINTLNNTFRINNNELLLDNGGIKQGNISLLEESEITIIAKEKYKVYCNDKIIEKDIYYRWTNEIGRAHV